MRKSVAFSINCELFHLTRTKLRTIIEPSHSSSLCLEGGDVVASNLVLTTELKT